MALLGMLRRSHGLLSLAGIATVWTAFVLATRMETTEAASAKKRRKLHATGFAHTHRFRPIETPMPTTLNSEYYTDDLAINDNMIRDKKDLYHEKRNVEQANVIASSLDGAQGLSSSASFTCSTASMLLAGSIVLVWSFF